jgi:hypothetical protein
VKAQISIAVQRLIESANKQLGIKAKMKQNNVSGS